MLGIVFRDGRNYPIIHPSSALHLLACRADVSPAECGAAWASVLLHAMVDRICHVLEHFVPLSVYSLVI